MKTLTLEAVHEALHTPYFLGKGLPFLVSCPVYPIIEERLWYIFQGQKRARIESD